MSDPLKEAVIETFMTSAPLLCRAIDDAVKAGATRGTISALIDRTVPRNTVTNQGAHLYLDSKNRR